MQQTSQQPTEKPSVTAEADAKTVVVEHGEERESWPFRKAMIYLFSTESAEVPWHPECAMCGRYYESRRVFSFMTPTKESGLNGKQFDLVCHDCAFERGFSVWRHCV